MSIDTFRKILKNVPSEIDIHFSGFSELFFHPQAMEFIDEACKEHEVVIYTTTNGMTQETADKLSNYTFKEFHVHLNQKKTDITLNFPVIYDTIDDTNRISRGGNLWEVPEHQGVCMNSPEFKQNVVLPSGDVVLCCMDYGLKHIIGNLLTTKWDDLKRDEQYEICNKCEKFI